MVLPFAGSGERPKKRMSRLRVAERLLEVRNFLSYLGFNTFRTTDVYGVQIMKRARRGFSGMEWIIIVVSALMLLVILLPALARLRDASREDALMRSPNSQTMDCTPILPDGPQNAQ